MHPFPIGVPARIPIRQPQQQQVIYRIGRFFAKIWVIPLVIPISNKQIRAYFKPRDANFKRMAGLFWLE